MTTQLPRIVILILLIATGCRAADHAMTIDGNLDDWEGIARIADPKGDDVSAHNDLVEAAITHDDTWLYFLLRVDDADGDYFGDSTRYEELTVYLDTDNNADTGYRVGGEGQQIGAEYAIHSARRVRTKSSWEGTAYAEADPSYANPDHKTAKSLGNLTGNVGLPRTTDQEVVCAFETGVPRDKVGLTEGGTVAVMIRAGRSGKGAHMDWLDQVVRYDIPAPADTDAATLRSPTLEYRFGSATDGMGLLALTHNQQQRQFLRVPDHPSEALFWKVEFTDNIADEQALITLTNNTPAASRKLTREADQWVLSWQGVALPDGSTFDVQVTGKPGAAQSGLDDWRIAVTNHSQTFGIRRTYFPAIELGVIGDSSTDDTIMMSPAEGRSLRNPIYWGLDIDGPVVNTDIYTDNAAVTMLPEQIDFGGFGAAQPHGLPYPSARGQMQLSAYYEKPGDFYYPDVRRGAGLYLAPHDGNMHPKLFFYTPNPRRGALLYEVAHHPDDSCKPGLDHAPPYATVIGGYEGDWFDATQIYREWAVTAPWTRPGTLAQRKDVPQWLKDMTVVVRADVNKGDNALVLDQLAPIRDAIEGPIGVQWYDWAAWEKRSDTEGFAFPARAEGPEGYEQVVSQIQSRDMYVFPYINSRLWDPDDAQFPEAEPYIMRHQDGKPDLNSWGGKRRYAHPCLQTTFWRDYLVNVCAELVQRYYPRGIYLDQGASAHFGGAFAYQGCFSREHGHPLGVTLAMVEAEHDHVACIRQAARAISPDVVLTGEGNAECFIDVASNKLIHYELWPGNVPLFAAVYHDYITAYGRTVTLFAKNPDDPIPAMRIGWQLALGNQIGRIWSGTIGSRYQNRPGYTEHLDYLVRAAKVRKLFADYLCIGRMMRPPHIDGALPTVTTHEWRKLDNQVTLPAVVGSTWQTDAGHHAALLTNISKQPVTLVWWLNSVEVNGTHLQRVYADRDMPQDIVLGPLVRKVTIPPLGIAFYKVNQTPSSIEKVNP